MLSELMPKELMLSVIILSVIHHAECSYVQCSNADCPYAECSECHYADLSYAECRSAECRGTTEIGAKVNKRKKREKSFVGPSISISKKSINPVSVHSYKTLTPGRNKLEWLTL
jgi:hypothetical protein